MTTSADIQMPPAAGSASRGTERPEDACARQVDGLFTYCLSVLCDHDAALAAVRSVRELAVRHHDRLRDPAFMRAWLYSLARYACLLRLADAAVERPERAADAPACPPPSAAQQRERQARLSRLAWPEAAGTTPQQREALELAVRHGLRPAEVAAVLGLPPEEASALLAQAGCEVERTRTALRVLAAADCPELERLGGGRPGAGSGGPLLGPALRRELVQHVDDCPTCRGTAERAAIGDPWPGTEALHSGGPGGGGLPLVQAPAAALAGTAGAAFLAGVSAGRRARHGRVARTAREAGGTQRPGRGRGTRPGEPGLRFDRQGFPRHRADSPDLAVVLRNRAVTTTVLAAVLAAPVAALWAAHRGGDGADGPVPVSAVRVDTPGTVYAQGDQADQGDRGAQGGRGGSAGSSGHGQAHVSGVLVSRGEATSRFGGETLPPAAEPASAAALPINVAGPSAGRPPVAPVAAAARPAAAQGLTVCAGEYGSRTVITLTNSTEQPIYWRAVSDAAWLRLSRDSGVLQPGQRITVIVTVDADRAPHGGWTAHIALQPSDAVVTLEGHGRRHGGGGHPHPHPSGSPSGGPGGQGPGGGSPGPGSSSPPPSGGPTGQPSPSGPPPSSPPPSSPEPSQQPSASASPGPSGRAAE